MKNKKYTPEQSRFLRKNYKRHSGKKLTGLFNRHFGEDKTEGQIRAYLRNHRITSGRTGCFEKDHKPWNTGTKGKGLTSANCTSFKKGNVPLNRKPLWSERIEPKWGYIEMKVPERNPYTKAQARYKCKHVWIWEQEHGPVPKGYVVAFVDGNPLNVALDNLMLSSRAELLRMNQHDYKNQPEELKPSVLALAKLEAKAGIRSRLGGGRRLGSKFNTEGGEGWQITARRRKSTLRKKN